MTTPTNSSTKLPEQLDMPALPISPDDILNVLQDIDIEYKIYHHAPIFTVAEGEHLKENIPGVHCRNLFLRDKKKKTYLIVAANETELDLKKLADVIGSGRLSFGSKERLWEMLGITPGSVNPFTVMHDTRHDVDLCLDADMMAAEWVNYHPNDNAQTIVLRPQDLIRFLDHIGHPYRIVDFKPAKP